MSKLSYLARVMSGVRLKKMNQMIDIVHDKCGQNKVKTFFDMCWCGARYGAGYYDYVMFGFYNMNGRQRDTYLTRVRNKKVIDHMNDLSYSDEFDDKLRFNRRFAKYLGRKTLNGETATLAEFTDFIAGQEAIFAKINHGDCGRGVNKLYVKDYESPAVMLDYIRRNQLVVLEQVLPQHPDMARLHPSSVNTMRILTDLGGRGGPCGYISVKMGRGDGYCDNSGQGGVLCRVDPETGRSSLPLPTTISTSMTAIPTPGWSSWAISCPWCRRPLPWLRRRPTRSRRWPMWLGYGHHTHRPRHHRGQRLPPERICASWRPSIRRRRGCGRTIRSCCTGKKWYAREKGVLRPEVQDSLFGCEGTAAFSDCLRRVTFPIASGGILFVSSDKSMQKTPLEP